VVDAQEVSRAPQQVHFFFGEDGQPRFRETLRLTL
jgi:hypothetical protein